MTTSDRAEQVIGDLLSKLKHVDLTYILADLCSLAGWDTQVGIGYADTVGDIVAVQSFPHPQAVTVVCSTERSITQEELDEMYRAVEQESFLAVVAKEQPTSGAVEFAQTKGILLFSLYDVAHEFASESGLKVIQEYLSHNSELSSQFESEIQELVTLRSELKSSDSEAVVGTEESSQADTRPLAESEDTRVGIYGFDYIMADGEVDVVLVAIRLECAVTTEFLPEEFTLHTAEAENFTGVSNNSETDVGQLAQKLDEVLGSDWTVGFNSVPSGEITNCLLFFNVDGNAELSSLSYNGLKIDLSPSDPTETYQGLPKKVCEEVGALLPGNFRDAPDVNDYIWSIRSDKLNSFVEAKATQSTSEEINNNSTEKTKETDDSANMNTDLLDEVDDAVQPVSSSEREPHVSVVGEGVDFSEGFSAPGGVSFFDMEFLDDARYKIKAVGETGEDSVVKIASDETPVSHRVIDKLDEGTYILNVEADDGARWKVDIYFSSPEPVNLPYSTSGKGYDVVGPIPHSGFIKIVATNQHTERLEIKQPKKTGKSYLNSPNHYVEASSDGSDVTNEQIISTVDGYKKYPWLEIRSDGEWSIEITPHS